MTDQGRINQDLTAEIERLKRRLDTLRLPEISIAPSLSISRAITGITLPTDIPIGDISQFYTPFVTRVVIGYRVQSPANATNYWAFNVRSVNTAYNAATVLVNGTTANTSSLAAPGWGQVDVTVNTLLTTNRARFDVSLYVNGVPGALDMYVTIYYRWT